MSHLTYLGLGSNLGDRQAYLQAALDAMPPDVRPRRRSPIYETAPWGYTEQADFLNQVVEAETELEPLALLRHLKAIEQRVGRQASFRYGPRQIDIDILLYDDLVFEEDGLSIPHPRLQERAFALKPLADLAPDYLHPVLGKTIRELLESNGGGDLQPFTDLETSLEVTDD
jgi:2-amino-4-hydroxy-6-hydroxymethyldihydropteridine diphosphokinase